MKLLQRFLIAAGILFAVISSINAAQVLLGSSYPCLGGNEQRTYKIDRNFHCPTVSGGRSTVLNVAWVWPPNDFAFLFTSTEITSDENGFIYVQGNDLTGFIILRVHFANGTLSTSDLGYRPESTSTQASLTHVASGFIYLGLATHSEYVQKSDMTAFVTATNPASVTQPASYIPFGQWMVKANVGLETPTDPLLTYWDSTIHLFDSNPPNFSPGYPLDVVVGLNETAKFLIVVADRSPLASYPIYSVDKSFEGAIASPPVRAWFEDSTLFVMGTEDFLVLNWTNSDSTSFTTEGSFTLSGNYLMTHQGKSFGHHQTSATQAEYYDRINDKQLTTTPAPYFQLPPIAQPIFSKRDNIVFYPKGATDTGVYFEGRQWNTWDVKITGKLPKNVVMGVDLTVTGVPVYGDNCEIAIVHDNRLYGLRPLPIQNVVPIFECYNPDTGIAFFSYDNLEQTPFSIPLTQDRNSFTPQSTPIEDFNVGRGPIYPLSAQLDVGKNLRGYRYWMLERYTVPILFDDNRIYCPTTINVILQLSANEAFPADFNNVVRAKFVAVTGISDGRVTLIAKKRSLKQAQSDLEVELAIAPDDSNAEPKPADVVQEFVTNQQESFTTQVNTDSNAPQNVTLDNVTGKELENQIVGIQDYVPPPMSPNMNSPSVPVATSAASSRSLVTRVYLDCAFILSIIAAVWMAKIN